MCLAPVTLANGVSAACHECWQCRERAINDWVGRNIAETKTSVASHAVTLTYGRNLANDVDHERSALLTYSDVQKFLKLLRRHRFPVRYFVTGEYGSKNGRAHWHIMLYWQDKVPPHVLDENFMFEYWDRGYSFWTRPTANAVRYNCKYIQKDMGDNLRQGHLAMSKKPPLGSLYFERYAEKLVAQGLAPQSLEYRFPEVRRHKPDGSQEVVNFMLKDRPAELYLEHYLAVWRATNPLRPYPPSDLLYGWERWGVLSEAGRDICRERDREQAAKEDPWHAERKARRKADNQRGASYGVERRYIKNQRGKLVERWVPVGFAKRQVGDLLQSAWPGKVWCFVGLSDREQETNGFKLIDGELPNGKEQD